MAKSQEQAPGLPQFQNSQNPSVTLDAGQSALLDDITLFDAEFGCDTFTGAEKRIAIEAWRAVRAINAKHQGAHNALRSGNDAPAGTPYLLPCPFCGAGEKTIHVNKGTWTGSDYGEPVSVEVRHWCKVDAGQPSRLLTRVGRDESSAIAAWNLRVPEPALQEQADVHSLVRTGRPAADLIREAFARGQAAARGLHYSKQTAKSTTSDTRAGERPGAPTARAIERMKEGDALLLNRLNTGGNTMTGSKLEAALNSDAPVLVLFSEVRRTGAGWEYLTSHSCGGFSCWGLEGWVYLLPTSTKMRVVLSAIANEDFCSTWPDSPSLDYGVTTEQREAYRSYLQSQGLSVSAANLASLTQAAYPLDATRENLNILAGSGEVPALSLLGLKLVLLGDNCD